MSRGMRIMSRVTCVNHAAEMNQREVVIRLECTCVVTVVHCHRMISLWGVPVLVGEFGGLVSFEVTILAGAGEWPLEVLASLGLYGV